MGRKIVAKIVFSILVFTLHAAEAPVSDESKLIEKIPFLKNVGENEAQYKSIFVTPKGGEHCTDDENRAINGANEKIVDSFFLADAKSGKPELSPAEIKTLQEIATDRFSAQLLGSRKDSPKECIQLISKLDAHAEFFATLNRKGFYFAVNARILSLLKPRLLKLAETQEMLEFLSETVLTYRALAVTKTSYINDSGLAVFLLAKSFDYNASIAKPATQVDSFKKIIASYKRYIEIYKTALGAYAKENTGARIDPQTHDFLSAYVSLLLLERNSENAAIIREGRYMNVNAYIETLLQIADLFPELVPTTTLRQSSNFNKIFAAEDIANSCVEQKVGNRSWLMAFIPTATNDPVYIGQFKAVASQMRMNIWKPQQRSFVESNATSKDKSKFAAHVLRLTSNILDLKPDSLANVSKMRSDIERQLKIKKDIVLVNVDPKLARGI